MRRLLAVSGLACLALLATAAPAGAAFGLKDLTVFFENQDGSLATQAGSHPFSMTTSFALNTEIVPDGAEEQGTGKTVDGEVPEGALRDIAVAQMPGFVGSQTAIPRCSAAQFATRVEGYASCPDETAVGIAEIKAEFKTFPVGTEAFLHLPIYNLEPLPGAAATFGFVAANVPITFDVVVNPKPPFNLVARVEDTSQALLVYGSKVILWGNPADPAHDTLRGQCVGSPTEPTEEPQSNGSCPVDTDEVPLLTLPRRCSGPLPTVFSATSWQGDADAGTALSEGMSECETLAFDPAAAAKPTTARAASPTGLDFGIEVDDEGLADKDGRAEADISAVRVALPAGMVANPSAAEGQGACTQAQFQAASLEDRGCPQEAKLATVEVASQLLAEPIEGSLYLAEPYRNPFGSLLAAYLVIRDPELGLLITRAGQMTPDPRTGQLTATFSDLPELPFSDLDVSFRSGPRAPLATPSACGTHTTRISLTPSSGKAPLTRLSAFGLSAGPGGGPCPTGAFSPGFQAGSQDNLAGAFSPFAMRFTRSDGEPQISGLGASLPLGLTGKPAGVGRCPEARIAQAKAKTGRSELASPSCPASSRIGSVVAGAGFGDSLTYVRGSLYLAGPYKGAPLSVVSVVPAVAGPFDLGAVVVRSALQVDPRTAQVRVDEQASDPIPTILAGIPLQVRDLRLDVDRPGFTLNPTSCEEKQATATLLAGARSATPTQRYQAQGCERLRFKPRLAMRLLGGTERGQNPALRSVLRPRAGDANLQGAAIRLPRSAFLDQDHIRTICTRVQFAADACPKGSVYGKVTAYTPLLDEPLVGNAYLRSSDNQLPDLVFDLKGTVDVEAVARIDSVKRGIRASFESLPDAPITKVVVQMQGGRKGLIQNSADLCAKQRRANAALLAHNAKRRSLRPVVGVRCGGSSSR